MGFVLIDLYYYENAKKALGFKRICGVDEAGRGALAGPVVACAVILKDDAVLVGVNDSKLLSKEKRQRLVNIIKENALSISTYFVYQEEIDALNIYQASKKAMLEAINNLSVKPDYILTDYMNLDGKTTTAFTSLKKGDQKSISIAAASIIAKETRDDYMEEMGRIYPNYEFEKHKGYPTKAHLNAIKLHGISKIHRKTYKPIKNILSQNKIIK